MSRIIKPQSKPIKRIEIDVDASGQAQVNAKNVLTGGPLHPFDVVLNLLQISVGMLAGAINAKLAIQGGENGQNEKKSD